MTYSVAIGLAIASGMSLTACNQATTNNQAAAENAPATEVTANGTGAETTNAAGAAQPSSNEVSSGMPVPGTNTPEHIVVNEDASHNRNE